MKGKLAYEGLETRRFVAKHGLTAYRQNPHFPVNTLMIMRGLIAARRMGVGDRYLDVVLAAMWEQGEKMDDPDVVARVLTAGGLNAAALLAATLPGLAPGFGLGGFLRLVRRAVLLVQLVLLRLHQVGRVEEGALVGPYVDEGRLDPRQDGFDLAEVDVAHRAAGIGTIHQQLNKGVVLQNRHAGLPRAAIDQNFPFQRCLRRSPRTRRAAKRRPRAGCPSCE